MRKNLIFLAMLLLLQQGYSQQTHQVWTEDFNDAVSFSANPTFSWRSSALYYLPDSSSTSSKSALGLVPNRTGDTSTFLTPVYNCTPYRYAFLRFSHICKISPDDAAWIEYRIDMGAGQMGAWKVLSATDTYLGSATTYPASETFNAASYSEWQASDNTILPDRSWWKEEWFDLQNIAAYRSVQFRFVIIHGNVQGTQASYGWLLENVEVTAANFQIHPPVVKTVSPYVKNTVYSTGPWQIHAKVKTATSARIATPVLKYTASNGIRVDTASLLMTHIQGDSLWKASIPQFTAGTTVSYSITGRDMLGNATTIRSEYVISILPTGKGGNIVLQDGSTDIAFYPFYPNNGYSRSMVLYTMDEIDTNAVGQISSVGLHVSNATNGAFPIKIWIKTVPLTKTAWSTTEDNLEWDVLTDNATLVYDGLFNFSPTGWVDVPLQQTFVYTRQENLVIMFEQNCGGVNCSGYMGNYPYYYGQRLSEARLWHKFVSNNPPVLNNMLYARTDRPDMRIHVLSVKGNNSAAMHSIDINDTIPTSLGAQTPLTVSVKNKGITPLDSITISYMINNGTVEDTVVRFTPALPWDINSSVTLGTHNFRLNGFDTLSMWISYPNGAADSTAYDDTLTKRIYGKTDISMEFVNVPHDTVYTTDSREITARLSTLSGAPIHAVSLFLTYMLEENTVYDTLNMQSQGSGLWTVYIPGKPFHSDITYIIKYTDILGNPVELSGKYYIKRPPVTAGGYVIVQDNGTNTNSNPPFPLTHSYGRSMTIYPANEMDVQVAGEISAIALRVARVASGSLPVKVYMKTVSAAKTSWDAITDNYDWTVATQDATLVYDGDIPFTSTGWIDIPLQHTFLYTQQDNLVVLFEHGCGGANCNTYVGSPNFYSKPHASTEYRHWYRYDNAVPNPGTFGRMNSSADLRLKIKPNPSVPNSVRMDAILQPDIGIVTAGVSTPIKARIRNMGINQLDSCLISWSLNDTLKSFLAYKNVGGLSEGFSDTMLIGSYIPSVALPDRISVWVSLPNGVTDSYTSDDTISISTFGCNAPLSGTLTVGKGNDYAKISDALNAMQTCGVGGDITLSLANGIYEEVNLENINDITLNYMLNIRSASGDRDSVIIRSAAGSSAAILLNKSNNITIEDITIDATAGISGINFTGDASNITINNCVISVNPTITNNTYVPVYKKFSTGSLDGLTVKNCTLDGGHTGINIANQNNIYVYYNITIDSNTFTNQSYSGITLSYATLKSISYNTITPRTLPAIQGASWSGMRYEYIRKGGSIVGNKIQADSCPKITTGLYGIYIYNMDTALIANNEIYFRSLAKTTVGTQIDYPRAVDYLHNTVLLRENGGTTSRALRLSVYNNANYDVTVKNNILAVNGGTKPYAIYLDGTYPSSYQDRYRIDYNNYFSTGNLGYAAGGDRADLEAWKQYVTLDTHSVSNEPFFIDMKTSLKLTGYKDLLCPAIPIVNIDKDQMPRKSLITAMGAYEYFSDGYDVMLQQLYPSNNRILETQTVLLSIDAVNTGILVVDSITLGWSINGNIQPSITQRFSSPMTISELQNIVIDTLPSNISNNSNFDVIVWIETVNGMSDIQNWNDTLSTVFYHQTLAEFVSPFVGDTLTNNLSFDILTKIYSFTGAPKVSPLLHIETIYNENVFIDSIPMTLNGDIWTATVLLQNYGSKVIYWVTVSDTIGTSLTIKDSVYLMLELPHLSVISPATDMMSTCEYTLPVIVFLENKGKAAYNFSKDNLAIGYEITGPNQIHLQGELLMQTGSIASGENETVELISSLFIYAGMYDMKVWLINPDSLVQNDTVIYSFTSKKIGLPMDEYFKGTNLPTEFSSTALIGDDVWYVYYPDANFTVQSDSVGTGILCYTGAKGTMAQLTTRQLDLYGSINPKLEFWYYHDTTVSEEDDSYTDVNMIVDGNTTTLLTVFKRNTVHGWTKYTVNLNSCTADQCVLIEFESMNKSTVQPSQYIDHIFITSDQDLAILDILVTPEIGACELANKKVSVVIATATNHSIDFSQYPTCINLELRKGTNVQYFNHLLNTNGLEGDQSDTLSMTVMNLDTGMYSLTAFVSVPIDNVQEDDTMHRVLDINPQFSIEIEKLSGSNPATAEFENQQKVTITNTGNMELSSIGLILTITSDDGSYIFNVKDTFSQNLQPNGIVNFTFDSAYIVPWSLNYTATVHGYLLCDSALVNRTASILEEVNITDLYIVDIISPSKNSIDTTGSLLEASISVRNRDLGSVYDAGIKIWLLITDTTGVEQQKIEEELPSISGIAPVPYTFTAKYTVPALPKYHLTVYIENKDSYAHNDTIRMLRQTKSGGVSTINPQGASFTMEQNIPNPAKGNTIINYTIPQDGEILFQLYSISGQLLYTKQESVPLGEHQIELNLSNYAAGIYFYTMEYKGRRISKRMSITR